MYASFACDSPLLNKFIISLTERRGTGVDEENLMGRLSTADSTVGPHAVSLGGSPQNQRSAHEIEGATAIPGTSSLTKLYEKSGSKKKSEGNNGTTKTDKSKRSRSHSTVPDKQVNQSVQRIIYIQAYIFVGFEIGDALNL